MHPDAVRWNARYRARSASARFDADAQLEALADRLGPPGRALDLACGTGGNALLLAARGWHMLGVDISIEALRLARGQAHVRRLSVEWLVADAARAAWPSASFQLVVVTRFLERAQFAPIKSWLAPGGLLYYATFNARHLIDHPGFNPDYVLSPRELDEAFADLVRIDGNDGDLPEQTTTWMLARREV